MKGLDLIIEVSQECNLVCKHCYYCNENKKGLMTIDEALTFVNKHAIDTKKVKSLIIFHGAEPLVWGLENYRKVFNALKGQGFGYSIQTNGLLLNDDFLKLFKDNNVSISFSLDYPQTAHDFFRVDKKDMGTYAKVLEKVHLTKSYGISVGANCVISNLNIHLVNEIYSFFKELGLSFNINPLSVASQFDDSLKKQIPSPKDYGKFLIELATLYLNDGDGTISINLIDAIFSGLIYERPFFCFFYKDCTYAQINCPRISDKDLEKRQEDNKNRLAYLEQNDCKDCHDFSVCYGGCPSNKNPIAHSDKYEKDYYCTSFQMLRSYLRTKI